MTLTIQNTFIARNPLAKYMIIDGECIILGPHDQIPYQLNRVGMLIWSLLNDTPLPAEAIIRHLCDRFNLTLEKATQSITPFLSLMLEKKIFISSISPADHKDATSVI